MKTFRKTYVAVVMAVLCAGSFAFAQTKKQRAASVRRVEVVRSRMEVIQNEVSRLDTEIARHEFSKTDLKGEKRKALQAQKEKLLKERRKLGGEIVEIFRDCPKCQEQYFKDAFEDDEE